MRLLLSTAKQTPELNAPLNECLLDSVGTCESKTCKNRRRRPYSIY